MRLPECHLNCFWATGVEGASIFLVRYAFLLLVDQGECVALVCHLIFVATHACVFRVEVTSLAKHHWTRVVPAYFDGQATTISGTITFTVSCHSRMIVPYPLHIPCRDGVAMCYSGATGGSGLLDASSDIFNVAKGR